MSAPFQFKQFRVVQEQAAMKVCTDACLFGAVIEPGQAAKILDIGTGTGLLALMLAQRCQAAIDAVEIEPRAAAEAARNFADSPWHSRLRVFENSVQAFAESQPSRYDLILANPPFFEQHLKRHTPAQNLALHSTMLTPLSLLESVTTLLHPEGSFWVLLPPYESTRLEKLALEQKLFLTEQYSVFATENGRLIRHISRFSYQPGLPEKSNIAIKNTANQYTTHFQELLKSYYLAF